mmetsp:Transcript_3584/g.3990  ORF Transcript_3584/g.3990 Transcript_3584/m.3990 type:complete len:305 (+) Transcript_3584:82-996(+)
MSQGYNKLSSADGNTQQNVPDLIDQDEFSQQQYVVPDNEENTTKPTKSVPRQQQPEIVQPQLPIDSTNSHMFQINFYRKFFELDTITFFEKIKRALNPINKSTSVSDDNDDSEVTELYGFIWITGTLIFLMFVSSTGANILSEWIHSDDKKYEYSFELLTLSISLFYGYNILVPVILYVSTTWILKFPHRLSLTKLISVYGYTNILWFPITAINFLIVVFVNNKSHHLVWNFLEWLIVLASGSVTGLSNLTKLSPIIKKNSLDLTQETAADQANKLYTTIMVLLAIAHLAFTILVKISFFGISV